MGILDTPGVSKREAARRNRLDLALNGPMKGMPVASESVWYDGGASSGLLADANSRKRHVGCFDAGSVRLVYANIRARDNVDQTMPLSVRSALEVEPGVTYVPTFTQGKRDAALEPGATSATDPLSIAIKRGQEMFSRTRVNTLATNFAVKITGAPTGGTFTLTINGVATAAIVYNASLAAVKAAVQLVLPLGQFVTVTGTVTTEYRLAFTNAPVVLSATPSLTGGSSPAITTPAFGVWPQQGGSPNTQSSTVSAWGEGNDGTNGATSADKTLSGTIGPNSVAQYSPFCVVGVPIGAIPNWIGTVGDSIMSGLGDSVSSTAEYGRGFIRRGLLDPVDGLPLPYVSIAASGESASEKDDLRRTILLGCVSVVSNLGINDMIVGRTLAQAQADLLRRWTNIARQGSRVYQTTITPQATSTDNWVTTTNQTPFAASGGATTAARRVDLNTWIRDGAPILAGVAVASGSSAPGTLRAGAAGHPLTAHIEVADRVESARNSGLWKPNLTSDGTHPNQAGHIAAQLTPSEVAMLYAD